MKKKSPKAPPITTVEEFNYIVDEIATLTLERARAALELEEAIARQRQRYALILDPLDRAIGFQFKRATKFAVLKRAELFAGDSKTSTTALAEFGFRFGKEALALLDGFEWHDVTDAIQVRIDEIKSEIAACSEAKASEDLKVELQRWNELIVTKTEPVKDQIKTLLTDEERTTIGTEKTLTESFWIEPKREKEAAMKEVAA